MTGLARIWAALCIAVLTSAAPVAAQQCSMKLSEFEAATRTYDQDVAALSRRLLGMFAGFSALEAEAVAAPDTCPGGLDRSRAAAEALDWRALVAQSDVLLDCAQVFSRRVLADVSQARANNDSQLILRLGELQDRIFDVERRAIAAAQQATFLGLRAEGLMTGHAALGSRCAILGDIYD